MPRRDATCTKIQRIQGQDGGGGTTAISVSVIGPSKWKCPNYSFLMQRYFFCPRDSKFRSEFCFFFWGGGGVGGGGSQTTGSPGFATANVLVKTKGRNKAEHLISYSEPRTIQSACESTRYLIDWRTAGGGGELEGPNLS